MTRIERIEKMMEMEKRTAEKDSAGVYIPAGMDSAIKVKAYQEVLKVLKG